LMEVMKKKPDAKITILGSQHSAFSVAHMLLEGPYKLRRTFTYTKKKREKRCKRCRTCAHTERCECAVNCLCYSSPREVKSEQSKVEGVSKVTILFRDKIRVHYSSIALAEQDGYSDFDKRLDATKSGIVYPFTGLRTDAKQLWRRIKNGQEQRVQLVQAPSPQEAKKHTQDADVVVWACGYTGSPIPFFSVSPLAITQEREVLLKKLAPNSSFEVTSLCQCIDAEFRVPFSNLFGIGMGYSLRTNDAALNAEARLNLRADSVGVYFKQTGAKLLP